MSTRSDLKKPSVSIVVIGLNVANAIYDCLQSIQKCNYPQEKLEIIYVDGGSRDESIEIASQFSSVKIIELVQQQPTPGRGRNAGWRAANHNIIQFLDGDTVLDKDWLNDAYPCLKDDVVAVTGRRVEIHPSKNLFHLIANIEWDIPLGFCLVFGGDVLIKKKALESMQGYNEDLIAAEDRELSYRLRKNGWCILSLPNRMTQHDIQMSSFFSYLKRACRTGHGYAKVAWGHRKEPEKFWMKELIRIPLGIVLPWAFLWGGMLFGYPRFGAIMAIGLAFRSVRKVNYYRNRFNIRFYQSLMYTLHLAFVIYPQVVGVLRSFFESIRVRDVAVCKSENE